MSGLNVFLKKKNMNISMATPALRSRGATWGAAAFMALFGVSFTCFGVLGLVMGIKGTAMGQHNAWVGLLVGALFTIIGLAFDVGVVAVFRIAKRELRITAQYPGQPWMLNKAWAAGRSVDDSGASAIGAWIFAGLWNAISLPSFVLALNKGDAGHMIWVIALFPLVGAGLLMAAIYLTARRMKFGKCVLEFQRVPGRIGGWLAGTIRTSASLDSSDGIHLQLKCVNRITTGAGKNSSTSEYVLWQDRQTLAGRVPREGVGLALPGSFAIPADCLATRPGSRDEILWRLVAWTPEPGIDFKATFTVPVFEVPGGEAPIPPQETQAAKLRSAKPTATQLASEARISVRKDTAGREFFEFPWTRNLRPAISMSIIGGLFGGVAFAVAFFKGPVIFPIIFGGIATLMLPTSVLWLKGRSITVRQEDVELHWNLLGFTGGQTLPRGQIVRIEYQSNSQVNNVAYYKIKLVKSDGPSVVAAAGLTLEDAKFVAEELGQAIGIETSKATHQFASTL